MKKIGLICHALLISIFVVGCSSDEESLSNDSYDAIEIEQDDASASDSEITNSLDQNAADSAEDAESSVQESIDNAETAAENEKGDWKETVEEVIETAVGVVENNKELIEKKDLKIPQKPKLP